MADRKQSSKYDQFEFGDDFLHDHVGQIMDDPQIAILELIANSYDAGATRVQVTWPSLPGDELSVTDDGSGMTLQELETRWRTIKYDRVRNQGPFVAFPDGLEGNRRRAFGHNGKGRFSPFCFADTYEVETWRDNESVRAVVELTHGGRTPFGFKIARRGKKNGHGTKITLTASRLVLTDAHVRELIGSKFAVVPNFEIYVNKQRVQLLDLKAMLTTRLVHIENVGDVKLYRLDPPKQERTNRLKGIAWWVNARMVGEPSWEGLDGAGQYLDGRSTEAKKFSFVVEAEVLFGHEKEDWSGFKPSDRVDAVRKAVHLAVLEELKSLVVDDRKASKRSAIAENRTLIKQLPPITQWQIGRFLDEAQERCPSLTAKQLTHTVAIWGKLEQSKSGYELLRQLASCSAEDLDTWNTLMQRWSASTAEVVLSELERRINVIRELQELVRNRASDEVHDLQPLFERGLWMFGPEYESVEFTSNRGMTHVVQEFFERKNVRASRRRPDFVVLPDATIGFYSADEFTEGEVSGVRKILVVELKRGDFCLGQKELDQARDYSSELRKTGCAQRETIIEAFVLGARIEPGLEKMTVGDRTAIMPCIYDLILKRAHSRIFNLAKRIEESAPEIPRDTEIEEVLAERTLEDQFNSLETGTSAIPS